MVFCYFYKFEQFGKKNLNILKGEPQVVIRKRTEHAMTKGKEQKRQTMIHRTFNI
jgi:hypothetical protein